MLSHSSSLKDVVSWTIGIINQIIPVLTVLALALFMWAVVRYILKAEESHGKGEERTALLWGIIALFVLFSVWGIVKILQRTLLS